MALSEYQRAAAHMMRALQAHVARYEHAPRQHSEGWHAAKSTSIGGSEIATLMGLNPYSSRSKLLARKAGLDTTSTVGVACWWGTMMEPVSENLVAAVFGHPVIGTDIHIRSEALPAHANSPDGYTVVPFVEEPHPATGELGWELCIDLAGAVAAGLRVVPVPVLVELKAPYQRHLKPCVPQYYTPQVLSGMALSPAALSGLYVEIVYRLCSLPQLAERSAEYSTGYHRKDIRVRTTAPPWDLPFALGVSAVYAPRMGTRAARGALAPMGAKGADQLAMEVLVRSCGAEVCAADLGVQVADIGGAAEQRPSDFDGLMAFIDAGEVLARHSLPCIVTPVAGQADAEVSAFIRRAQAEAPPENYYLMGFMPWKVFDVGCHQIKKDPAYIETLRPFVDDFMRDLQAITGAASPALEFARLTASEAPSPEAFLRRQGMLDARSALFAMHAASD